MAMLKAVVFDFDGVIVDSEPLHYQSMLRVVAKLGVEFSYAQYMDQYIGFDDRDAFRAISRLHNLELTEAGVADLVAEKAKVLEMIIRQGIEAFPGVEQLIKELAGSYRLAICSGALANDIKLMLPAIGGGDLTGYFERIITADDVAQSKPDPEGYAMAAAALGAKPYECVAIEDTPTGLAAARAAGLRSVAVAHTYGASDLIDHAEKVVGGLPEISAAKLGEWFGS